MDLMSFLPLAGVVVGSISTYLVQARRDDKAHTRAETLREAEWARQDELRKLEWERADTEARRAEEKARRLEQRARVLDALDTIYESIDQATEMLSRDQLAASGTEWSPERFAEAQRNWVLAQKSLRRVAVVLRSIDPSLAEPTDKVTDVVRTADPDSVRELGVARGEVDRAVTNWLVAEGVVASEPARVNGPGRLAGTDAAQTAPNETQ